MSLRILGIQTEQLPQTSIHFSGEKVIHSGDYKMVCDHDAGKKHSLASGAVFPQCPRCKQGTVGWIQVPRIHSSPDLAPEEGFYRTTCADLVTQKFKKGDKLPVCPHCRLGDWVQV